MWTFTLNPVKPICFVKKSQSWKTNSQDCECDVVNKCVLGELHWVFTHRDDKHIVFAFAQCERTPNHPMCCNYVLLERVFAWMVVSPGGCINKVYVRYLHALNYTRRLPVLNDQYVWSPDPPFQIRLCNQGHYDSAESSWGTPMRSQVLHRATCLMKVTCQGLK